MKVSNLNWYTLTSHLTCHLLKISLLLWGIEKTQALYLENLTLTIACQDCFLTIFSIRARFTWVYLYCNRCIIDSIILTLDIFIYIDKWHGNRLENYSDSNNCSDQMLSLWKALLLWSMITKQWNYMCSVHLCWGWSIAIVGMSWLQNCNI